jgi:AraC family transcriptional regulator
VQQKRASVPSRVLTSAGRGWPGIEVARFTGFDEISIPPLPKHHVVIYLNRHRLDLTQRLDGQLRRERVHHGEVAIIPAGPPWEWAFKGTTESDLLPLCLTDAFLREVAQSVEIDPDGVEIVPLLGVRDPQIERIGFSLKAEVEADGLVGGKLYAESLANALAIHLIRDHSSLGSKTTRKIPGEERNGGLSKRALKSAIDYIGDNLQKDLILPEIAGAAHMSPYHFSRLFKESTGLTPHQYVIERRVQRAKELLSNTDLPIAEVAFLCGFAHQSHLNRHFKRLLGVNPKALR